MKNALTFRGGGRGSEAPEERHVCSSVSPIVLKPRRGDMFCPEPDHAAPGRSLYYFWGLGSTNMPALTGLRCLQVLRATSCLALKRAKLRNKPTLKVISHCKSIKNEKHLVCEIQKQTHLCRLRALRETDIEGQRGIFAFWLSLSEGACPSGPVTDSKTTPKPKRPADDQLRLIKASKA
jgi:hypothetical protein